jgi:hypothetical protein
MVVRDSEIAGMLRRLTTPTHLAGRRGARRVNVSELLRLLETEHDETAARADTLHEQIERLTTTPALQAGHGHDSTGWGTQHSVTKQEATDSRPLLCHVAAQQRTGRPEFPGFSPRSTSTRCGYAARVNCHQLTLNKKPLPPLNVR